MVNAVMDGFSSDARHIVEHLPCRLPLTQSSAKSEVQAVQRVHFETVS